MTAVPGISTPGTGTRTFTTGKVTAVDARGQVLAGLRLVVAFFAAAAFRVVGFVRVSATVVRRLA
jgi:hypothetical protein